MDDINEELKRLNIENLIWIIFIILSLLSILGNYDERMYLKEKNSYYKDQANKIFEFSLVVTFFIYLYFFTRNYEAYNNATIEQKELYQIKVIGTLFLIAGILCSLYFQQKQTNFFGSPAL